MDAEIRYRFGRGERAERERLASQGDTGGVETCLGWGKKVSALYGIIYNRWNTVATQLSARSIDINLLCVLPGHLISRFVLV